MPLSLSWLSFLAAPRLTESPPVSPGGPTSYLADASPRQLRCANSSYDRQARAPQTGLRHDELATNGRLSNCSRTARHGFTRFVPTRPSLKDYSQEGFSESPRFKVVGIFRCTTTIKRWRTDRRYKPSTLHRIESRDYSFVTCFHTTEVTRCNWYTNPATTNGLLRKASVALQCLLNVAHRFEPHEGA